MADLPLFPLPDTVVFPGMTVPLQVFEERYKRLVRNVLDSDAQRFVIGLQLSSDVIRDREPRFPKYGTFVDLISLEENIDGTFNLLVHGQERCRLQLTREELITEPEGGERPLYFVDDQPEPLERTDPNQERVLAWDAVDTFRSYAESFFAFDAARQIEEALPDDPMYQASFICANIRIPAESRQVLLDAPSLSARLTIANGLMQERLAAHQPAREE